MSSSKISERTETLFQQIENERQKQSKFIKLQGGETRILQFNTDDEKIKLSDDEFEGKITTRVHYTVIDPKLPLEGEKTLPMSLTNAMTINALLKKGLNLLEVKRIGSDRNTKYIFAPA